MRGCVLQDKLYLMGEDSAPPHVRGSNHCHACGRPFAHPPGEDPYSSESFSSEEDDESDDELVYDELMPDQVRCCLSPLHEAQGLVQPVSLPRVCGGCSSNKASGV